MLPEMTAEQRIELSKHIIGLLDSWNVIAEDQLKILALPDGTRTRMLRSYRDNTPLPDIEEVNKRIEHILGITEALRTTYPHNPKMSNIWMRKPHRRFMKRTPIATIIEDGLQGLISVRMHLDCSWFNN